MSSFNYTACILANTITFVQMPKTMEILENFSLQSYNTFGIAASTRYFAQISSENDLQDVINDKVFSSLNMMVLGGGSNILLRSDFPGIILKADFSGIQYMDEDDKHYYIKVGAGENWHNFVLHCVSKGYGGIENLSLIPGNIGAAPIQNIGAYGVELKDVFHELEALHLMTGEKRTFSKEECSFAYRDSVFKNRNKGEYMISYVKFKFSKDAELNVTYAGIQEEINKAGITEPTIKAVSDAVCKIRRSKLPDPSDIGNAGSFFKNPIVTESEFETLKIKFPELVYFKTDEGFVKLAAAWLIDQCEWKGKRFGDAGVHKEHALVLSNYGAASGEEIFDLSAKIKSSVEEKFGISLDREVNVI